MVLIKASRPDRHNVALGRGEIETFRLVPCDVKESPDAPWPIACNCWHNREAEVGRARNGGCGMGFLQSDAVEVKRAAGKGRGVFARRAIGKGEVFERVPILLMTQDEYAKGIDRTILASYCFGWEGDRVALALGYGSIYNHSFKPNARYDDIGDQAKEFTALRAIEAGEEITINYNGKPRSRAKVWFDVVEAGPAAVAAPPASPPQP